MRFNCQVQDKHYIIREPEDDLAVAKKLVATVIGQTLLWSDAHVSVPQESLQAISDDMTNVAFENPEDEQEENDDLEHWENGQIFGIKPLGELGWH